MNMPWDTQTVENAHTPRKSLSAQTRTGLAVGWIVSLAIHITLLLIFSGITWLSGYKTNQTGTEVEIVSVAPNTETEKTQGSLVDLRSNSRAASLSDIDPIETLKPVKQLTENSQPDRQEIIGSEVISADISSAGEGDWSSLTTSQGPGSSASFFGLEARGKDFVYVVDYSGSMQGQKIKAAKQELIRSIDELTSRCKFYIIFYNKDYITMPAETMLRANQTNKQTMFRWVEQLTPGGGTDPRQAVKHAISLNPDAIYLLSDGIFERQACDDIDRANRMKRIPIHTIAYYSKDGRTLLKRISADSNGRFEYISQWSANP